MTYKSGRTLVGSPATLQFTIDPATGCWVWNKDISVYGYGRLWIKSNTGRKKVLAHRYMYECLKGQIEVGLHLDHLCLNKRCVNPNHLEPVTPRENARRALHSNGKKSLTDLELAEIRKALLTDSIRSVARKFNTYYNTIYCVAHGITYK
jgi:hypothetical protein